MALAKDATGGIERAILESLAVTRLEEFDTLRQTGIAKYATAMYLGGYACECLLKARICRILDVDHMPTTFHSHDLEALLLHAGLARRMQSAGKVSDSFKAIVGAWNDSRGMPRIRYDDPVNYDLASADEFDRCLSDPADGVIPWLKAQP